MPLGSLYPVSTLFFVFIPEIFRIYSLSSMFEYFTIKSMLWAGLFVCLCFTHLAASSYGNECCLVWRNFPKRLPERFLSFSLSGLCPSSSLSPSHNHPGLLCCCRGSLRRHDCQLTVSGTPATRGPPAATPSRHAALPTCPRHRPPQGTARRG